MDLASFIDHTLLKKEATPKELENLCLEAVKYNFKGVCVYPEHLAQVIPLLAKKTIIPIAVVDFPLGAKSPQEKGLEAKNAITLGAREIDMVIDYNALKQKNYALVFKGIQAVVLSAAPYPVKVIIETAELDHDQKVIACALAKAAKAAFIKTSTGKFSGATVEDIQLIRKIIGTDMYIKASGGIKTFEDAKKMIEAGADRIGTSASLKIISAC
ncbi:MAG: deoxyribose-phosphate aldolase [Chlamydiae bacterium]|nr:deoxyribose-phosphate aldolase [Chlamydiota bacterium]